MVSKNKNVKSCKCHLPEELYEAFILKIVEEGWTIQEALFLLILNYTEGRFDINNEEI